MKLVVYSSRTRGFDDRIFVVRTVNNVEGHQFRGWKRTDAPLRRDGSGSGGGNMREAWRGG
jgi:hypothetical protein